MSIEVYDLYDIYENVATDTNIDVGTMGVLAESLLDRYQTEPWRYYHTELHIAEMTSFLLDRTDRLSDQSSVLIATLGHDAIYIPQLGGGNNESLSAQLTVDLFKEDLPIEKLEKVSKYILATASHEWDGVDADMGYFLDADMSILAAEPAAFDEYDEKIRLEFSFVPTEVFCEKRGEFLRAWSSDDKIIFSMPDVRDELEDRAKENLARKLEEYK